MQKPGVLAAMNQAPSEAPALEPRAAATSSGAGWIFLCVGVMIVCQLALLSSALAPARVVFRSAAFGVSFFNHQLRKSS